MIVLGIETSCDETAAAIVTDNREILSNVVLRQLEEHALFGGVVPEIAARAHIDHLDQVVETAFRQAKLEINSVNAIAATCGPGLIGGVLVGMMTAKAMASSLKVPFLAVNHLEAHALTPRLTDNIEFPYLVLLISGGHTQILVAEDVGRELLLVIERVGEYGGRELSLVRKTDRPSGGVPGAGERGEEDSDQKGDDGDDHEELDERESRMPLST